jgi:hypothetical protein
MCRLPCESVYFWIKPSYTFLFICPYCTVQYSTLQYSTVQYSTVQYSTLQYSTVQYSTVQYSTVQYSTVQYGTVRYSTVQYRTVQYSACLLLQPIVPVLFTSMPFRTSPHFVDTSLIGVPPPA